MTEPPAHDGRATGRNEGSPEGRAPGVAGGFAADLDEDLAADLDEDLADDLDDELDEGRALLFTSVTVDRCWCRIPKRRWLDGARVRSAMTERKDDQRRLRSSLVPSATSQPSRCIFSSINAATCSASARWVSMLRSRAAARPSKRASS